MGSFNDPRWALGSLGDASQNHAETIPKARPDPVTIPNPVTSDIRVTRLHGFALPRYMNNIQHGCGNGPTMVVGTGRTWWERADYGSPRGGPGGVPWGPPGGGER